MKHACYVLVAVNKDPHHHFVVSCDATHSINVVSTRERNSHGLCTQDYIPPNHRYGLKHKQLLLLYHYNSQFVCLFVYLSSNYSQLIGPRGFKFSGFDGGHPGDVLMKFGED